jgi:FkbM family methyltransferase
MKLRDKLTGFRALWHFDNRWQLIFSRLFFNKSGLLVYKINNLEFLVDHDAGDHNATRLCLISDIYRRFLPKMKLGDTLSVFDLGANGGGFPLMLLLDGKRFSRLVCVEMNPNTFRRLQYNVSRNIDADTVLIQAAVCGNSRRLDLTLGRGDISDSIYSNTAPSSAGPRWRYSIEGRTFNDLFRAHFGESIIDICKMDIEGAEYEVLASSEHDRLRFCRYFIVELHKGTADQHAQFMEAVTALGFSQIAMSDDRVPGERLYWNEKLNRNNS